MICKFCNNKLTLVSMLMGMRAYYTCSNAFCEGRNNDYLIDLIDSDENIIKANYHLGNNYYAAITTDGFHNSVFIYALADIGEKFTMKYIVGKTRLIKEIITLTNEKYFNYNYLKDNINKIISLSLIS